MIERQAAPPACEAAAETGGWQLEVSRGSAAELHNEAVSPQRCVRVGLVTGTSLVLGSSQEDPGGPLPAGVELVRRRSGGGAVWLSPADQLWVDVVIPAGDPLWEHDVGRSALWLGAAWARCIGAGAEVSPGPMQFRDQGAVACFAGLGPGEVTVDGSKVVGISQRRTRELARFQTVAYLRWDPTGLIEALEPNDAVVQRLDDAVAALPADGGEWDVVERLLSSLT